MKSEQINEIVGALAKAQMEMTSAVKDCINPHFRSKYSDINSLLLSCRPILAKHGIAICQTPEMTEKGIVLTTGLYHEASGQWFEGIMPITIKSDGRNDLQALGSCISYLRRYCLAAMVGIASEDDDGNDAKDYQAKPQPKPEPVVVPMVAPVAMASPQQITAIRGLMAQCSNDYTTKVMEWLATQGVMALDKLNVKLYEIVKKRIEAHLASDEIQDAIVGEV